MNNSIRQIFAAPWALNGRTELPDNFNGDGSSMWYTAPLRHTLVPFLQKHGITSMLDAPCGAAHWTDTIQFPDGFEYLGADLHQDIIDRNNKVYSRKFVVLDITEDDLPSKDLMFVRDCLFHLSSEFKLKFFKNFLRANFKYLLTSNHPRNTRNEDLLVGDFREINWMIEPWNFGQPVDVIVDYDEADSRFLIHPYRTMCLWTREQIESFIK